MGDGCRRWRSSSRPFAGAESGSPGRALEAGKRGSPGRAVQAGIRGKRLTVYVGKTVTKLSVEFINFTNVTRSTDLRNKSGHVNSGKSTSKFVGVIFH